MLFEMQTADVENCKSSVCIAAAVWPGIACCMTLASMGCIGGGVITASWVYKKPKNDQKLQYPKRKKNQA